MDKRQIIFGILIGLMISLLIFSLVSLAFGEINLKIIKHLESRGNPFAIGKAGEKGHFQIMPCVLKEYNRMNNATYSTKQLFIPSVNRKIASWYLMKRIPQMLRYYKLPTTLLYTLASYNWGIKRVRNWHRIGGQFERLPRKTQKYIVNYVKKL